MTHPSDKIVDHKPVSQHRTRGGSWKGKCSCGVPFNGKDVADFQAAWQSHQESVKDA